MKESFKIKVNDPEELNIYKFVALLQASMEFFFYSKEVLAKNMELALSTKYKERFGTPNRKQARVIAKAYEEEMQKFNVQFKAFKIKNDAMLTQLEGIKTEDQEKFDKIMDELIEFINKLIVKDE